MPPHESAISSKCGERKIVRGEIFINWQFHIEMGRNSMSQHEQGAYRAGLGETLPRLAYRLLAWVIVGIITAAVVLMFVTFFM